MHRRLLVPVVLTALAVGGCSRNQPVATPVPETPDDDAARRAGEDDEARRRAEADSLAAEEAARRAREEASRRAHASLTEMVHFGYDEFGITPEASVILRTKAEVLRANQDVNLRIEGHADERGSNEYNLALGMRRATAARDFLTNFGLSANRFQIVSFGEERPLATGSDEAAWAQNRRAEFHITAGGPDLVWPSTIQ